MEQQKSTHVISFRLDQSKYEALTIKAAQKNMKPNEFARLLVSDYADDEASLEWVRDRIESLEKKLITAGLDLAFGLEKVLLILRTEGDDIETWIEEHIRCFSWNKTTEN